jgi:hypothetical protein
VGVSGRVLAAAGVLVLALVGATGAASRAGRPLRGIKTWAVYYGAAPEAAADLAASTSSSWMPIVTRPSRPLSVMAPSCSST